MNRILFTLTLVLLSTTAMADGSVTLPVAEEVQLEGVDDWTWRYEVMPGDTVSERAWDFGATVEEVRLINPGLDLDRIEVGQLIRFPIYEEECGC